MWITYKSGDWWVVGCHYSDNSISVTKVHVKSKYSALKLIHYLNGGELEPTTLTRLTLEDEEYQTEQTKRISNYLNK